MTPPQVNKRLLLVSIMPGSKITLPSSHCIVVVLLVVGFIPLAETHNVTLSLMNGKMQCCLWGLTAAISNNKWQTTPSSTRVCGKIVSLIKKCIFFWLWGWGYFKYMHIIFLCFTSSQLSPLAPPPLSSLSHLHPLLLSLSCSLAPPLSLCSK